ncbi:DUF4307 domain-containing protein [Actinocorallia longicatena]|uniref:DUF4307 domain-containing protein n=1 Tax=Actinocorallia longicatena TaxID=111803 RepID=A0ABP6Q2Y5_9ACTN
MTPETPERTSPWKDRIFFGALGLVVVAFVGGWAVIMGNAGGDGPAGLTGVSGETIGFRVQSDTAVQVTFQIKKPEDALVKCVVKARAHDGLTVGQTEVSAQPGRTGSTQVIVLPTTARATTAEVLDCDRT